LLSAAVVLGAQAFKTVSFTSTGGNMSENSGGYTVSGPLNVTSGTAVFTSPTLGTMNETLSGSLTSPQNLGTDSGTVSMNENGSNLSGTATMVMSNPDYNYLGGTTPVTGTVDTSNFAATINWPNGSGTWNGTIVGAGSAFDIQLTTPQWVGGASPQVNFGFNVAGGWHKVPTASMGTPLATITAYWASGTTVSSEISQISGDTIPVYWNQASGTGTITGVSAAPTGAKYILLSVVDNSSLLTDEPSSGNLASVAVPNSASISIGNEIISTVQPGFWSNSAWTASATGLDNGTLVSSSDNGSKSSQAAWWFSLPAGTYDVGVTYTPGSNLTTSAGFDIYDGVGKWLGTGTVNEQTAPSDYTDQGVGWKRLGSFTLKNNIFHISTWNGATDGALSIDAIELRAVSIIGDTDAGGIKQSDSFSTTGTWTTPTGSLTDSHASTSTAGSGSSTATWTAPAGAGTFEVDATWAASASLSASVTYKVYDGSTLLQAVTVDQQNSPSGVTDDGVNWTALGTFTVATQLKVTVANTAADGQVSADAVRLVSSYQPAEIVANSYPGSWVSPTGWTSLNNGLYGTALVSNTTNGSESSQAAWWFPCRPGVYEVDVTWQAGSGDSQNVGFDVYNASKWLTTATVNEQNAPSGTTDQGVVWQSLGDFTMTSNVLHVSTWNSPTDGAISISGVRIVPVSTTTNSVEKPAGAAMVLGTSPAALDPQAVDRIDLPSIANC
jgi:hypothetical protein